MTIKHRSHWVTHSLTTTSPSGHRLLLAWNPQAHRVDPLLPFRLISPPAPPCWLSLSSMNLLSSLLRQSFSFSRSFYIEPTTHYLTWLIPTHSSGFSSNIIYSGRFCWGPQSSCGFPVTTCHNSVVSLLHSVWLFMCLCGSIAHCLPCLSRDLTWGLACLGLQIDPQ